MLKGITPEQRQAYKNLLLATLQHHKGRDNPIGVLRLYEAVFGVTPRNKINATRFLRRLLEELREEGAPIGSTPAHEGGGYYLITDSAELQDYCTRLKHQGIRKIRRAQKINQQNLPELIREIQQTLLEEA